MGAERGMECLVEIVTDSYLKHCDVFLEDEYDLLYEAGELDINAFLDTCSLVCGRKKQAIFLDAARNAAKLAKWCAVHIAEEDSVGEAYFTAINAVDQYAALKCMARIAREYMPDIAAQCYALAKITRQYALEAIKQYKKCEQKSLSAV